ncbi:MAG TPA: TetR family transcriptional regulator [Candidatus Limnocylindrales bacterium]|nr:TetR family transcriptional regulator [Candidatus Limnocylindrales bacterium]
MATRDSTATKQRILDAATAEFAQYGLAGARVDRIASRADANKQLIYAYFTSKEGLFDAAMEANIARLLDTVPFDAEDLPAYAGRLFDFAVAHPQLVRLLRWHQLERPGVLNQLPQTAESNRRKLVALAEAQAARKVSGDLPADQLLTLILALIHGSAETIAHGSAEPVAVERKTLITGVRRLITPP